MIYQEGIYVGYKYYETRYEDFVTGSGNAGDYAYSDIVAYPFGYGLSYTDFSYSDMNVQYNAADDTYDVSVKVTNTGAVAGKETVQVYVQSMTRPTAWRSPPWRWSASARLPSWPPVQVRPSR